MCKEDDNDENYIYYIIGQNIKKQRQLKKWTQEKLANECNFDLSFIGKLESKKTLQTISVTSINHIAKILGINIKKLFEELDAKENDQEI